ncbi:MAG: radical SAM protein, partial [Candidatus Omnitrophica bacterium]|nr:radical SAM protein [Candidatus Omnitrophota bacterium]
RSADNVSAEIRLLKSQGYRAISFIDDQFIWDTKRLQIIGDCLASNGFAWGCLARSDRINEDIARILAETKCSYVDIGVESFKQPILDDIKKDAVVEECLASLALLKKYKVNVKLNVLIGASPLETKETIRNTYAILKKVKPYAVMFSICNPFPGTEFWDVAMQNHWLLQKTYTPVDVQKESSIAYPHLSKETLEREVRWLNFKFYFSLHFLALALKSAIMNPRELVHGLKSIMRKLW